MRDLNYQLKMLCKHSHEGSFETRVGRERQLSAIANQLHDLGFRQLKATSLKQKHVQALVDHWLDQNLSPGTIKNRMSCLRWWAEKVNKRAVVAGSNDFYGIPDRQFVSDQSKAKDLTEEQLARVKDEHVRMSLRLQQAFGLRQRGSPQDPAPLGGPGRSPATQGQLDQGRAGTHRPHPHPGTARPAGTGQTTGRVGLPDPRRPAIHRAAQDLRAPHRQCRAIENARPAPCLCPAAVSGTHRLALAPCGWAFQRAN